MYNQVLCILNLIINDGTEVIAVFWIEFLESLNDLDGVLVVCCKDDGFTDFLSSFNRETNFHQITKHGIHRIVIVDVTKDFPRLYIAFSGRHLGIGVKILQGGFILPDLIQLLLLFGSPFVIFNTSLHYVRGAIQNCKVHKMIFIDCLCQPVLKIRVAAFPVEEVEGTLVNILTWSGGKADHQSIKVVQDCNVFAEDGAVCLINDNQVEAADGE